MSFRTKDPRFELKEWSREHNPKTDDPYALSLGAPDGVEQTLSCDRGQEAGRPSWTCTCLEEGSATKTAKTSRLEPKNAVEIAGRARELCGWPYWADCPKGDWLVRTIMDRF